jgi:hypothetical protein
MDCNRIVFNRHALQRMFEREIGTEQVLGVLNQGTVVLENPDK